MKNRIHISVFALLLGIFFLQLQLSASKSKIDVWDFGAVQLDETLYINQLTVQQINAWYVETIVKGSSGNVLPNFSAGVLNWVGGGNDRLRTTNTNLTRYDENIAGASGYTGRIYVNSAAAAGRYLSLTLGEDDEVTIIAKTDAGGNINFQYVALPSSQTDKVEMSADLTQLHFVAKKPGVYRIFDTLGKPSYYRIYRKAATYTTITGSIDLTQAADIPQAYAVMFKNEAGKTWTSTMTGSGYTVTLPAGYSYQLSLSDANGYIIDSGSTLAVAETTTSYNFSVKKVDFITVTGAVNGLGAEISNLQLVFRADPAANTIYQPTPVINAGASTYTVQLEPNIEYTISANGVNDFFIPVNTLTAENGDKTFDLVFSAKPLYTVTINTVGLSAEQVTKLGLIFSNLNEAGYQYSFNTITGIALRNGIYTIAASGLDDYAVELGLTSNLKIEGSATAKALVFNPVFSWDFADKNIAIGNTVYKGLLFTGNISNEVTKGHLLAKPGATIQIQIQSGEKVRVAYYYSADFSFIGGAKFTTSSGSTGTLEYAEYIYPGTTAGYATITIGSGTGTTYISNISVSKAVAYQPVITVGADKAYPTINNALAAVAEMKRNDSQRVTLMIDPGNYEEMLVIDQPNITLKNAATTPSISLENKGVNIAAGAVRITSYYGHGYSYYSMANNQKWDTEILRVNKENGTLSYENRGSGTTNGSFWNATLVISANGFEAENIIFENSFNQYISQKEADDVVVMWESGNKGLRPVNAGNTDVQDKSFVERAAAVAITNNTDKVVLNNCRVVGRQDSFFGGNNTRVVVYRGAMMGGTDYLFGGMTAVFYKTDLVMNTSDNSNDVSYITAAQQTSGRGYLMYECNIKSAVPGIETTSQYLSKPGYFGRPWQAKTSEVVFYKTKIGTTDYTGYVGKSLIIPVGWLNTLGGESNFMYEYATTELSGENNQSRRASWSTLLNQPALIDGTAITTFNFTKGSDNWDPIPALVENDTQSGLFHPEAVTQVVVNVFGDSVFVMNVTRNTTVRVYNINGSLIKTIKTDTDTNFNLEKGVWIVKVSSSEGHQTFKVGLY